MNNKPIAVFPKKPVILFVIGSLEFGGAEKQMYTLISKLQSQDFSCHVFSLQQGGPLDSLFMDLRVQVHCAGLRKGELLKRPWKVILAQLMLIKTIIELKPIVVHSFLPLITFMGALAGRICRVPLVVTSRRALGTHQQRHSILRPLDLMANRMSHRVTVNSNAVWKDIINRDHIQASKLVLIYNGVDPKPFEEARSHRKNLRRALGIRSHERIVIFVANLIPYKGHLDAVKAAKQVVDRIRDVKFLFVGEDRGIQKDLEEEVSKMGISKHVNFLGSRNDIPYLLVASDLAVVSSHEEGFSNVILESMAAGLPVVATNVGGNPEAVVDGVTGWLVPPRKPEELAMKIVDLLVQSEKARSWGVRGSERVKKYFTVERLAEKHIELYQLANGEK